MPETSTSSTRLSLLARVKDSSDQQAWDEFTEIYWPVVYRLARRKGLQHADAEDLAQQVLIAVAGAIDDWEPDSQRGRFRAWLYRIAQNQIINSLSRVKPGERGSGDTQVAAALGQQPAPEGPDSELLAIEYRREIFRWAARQIRDEFHPTTWQAFWMTAVEQRDVDEVARELDKNRGAIYTARSRVMRRLNEKVKTFNE